MNAIVNIKQDWQQALIQAVTTVGELASLLDLNPADLNFGSKAQAQFALKVPRSFVDRMEKGNPRDPLLLQVLPDVEEEMVTIGYGKDPLDEKSANPVAGLLRKYKSRALLTLTGNCAINCRYCFRRHFPYGDNTPGPKQWEPIFDFLKQDTDINEVILSGGDPLLLNDRLLQSLTDKLVTIPHIKRLRIHSRVPVVLPERITEELLAWIRSIPLKIVLVIHSNHPREINEAVTEAMKKLKAADVILLNQSVLLKGINDDVATLRDLSEALFAAHVQPYYLHVMDKVQGTAHFDMKLAEAKSLYQQLTHELPGYLVPKLVQEISGEKAKTILA